MKHKPLRMLALVVAATSVSACMGSFVLTRGLYRWNETVTDSKVVNNVIFWALNIVPIYSLCVTGDAVIFNFIEFWTGKNLLADAGPGADRVAVAVADDGTITVTRGGEHFLLVPRGPNRVDVLVDGVRKGSAERTATGGVVAFDDEGRELGVVTPEELEIGAELAAGSIIR